MKKLKADYIQRMPATGRLTTHVFPFLSKITKVYTQK